MFYFIHIHLNKSVLKKRERNIPIIMCEFFCNPLISSKYRCKTETETQAETQTRKHAHDPPTRIGKECHEIDQITK